MVIPTAQDDSTLRPDDLRPNLEAGRNQAPLHHVAVKRAVPNVRDVAREQVPRFTPIRTVVIAKLLRPRRPVYSCSLAPRWIVVHAVRRVREHKMRAITPQKEFN